MCEMLLRLMNIHITEQGTISHQNRSLLSTDKLAGCLGELQTESQVAPIQFGSPTFEELSYSFCLYILLKRS